MPAESAVLLQKIIDARRLWLVVWKVGEDAHQVEPGNVESRLFHAKNEGLLQLFLGDPGVVRGPVFRVVNGRRLLDFSASYALQVVPSLLIEDRKILLQGSIGVLAPEQYRNADKFSALVRLYEYVQLEIKDRADRRHVIAQRLPDGKKKVWTDIFLGKDVVQSTIGVQLKQFLNGEVVFTIGSREDAEENMQ